MWKKHIQKQEEKTWLYQSCDNSGRKTVSTHSNLSILGILESAVKEKVSLRQSSLYQFYIAIEVNLVNIRLSKKQNNFNG